MQYQLQGMDSAVTDLDIGGCDWEVGAVRYRDWALESPEKLHLSDNGVDISCAIAGTDGSYRYCASCDERLGLLGAGQLPDEKEQRSVRGGKSFDWEGLSRQIAAP
jgi:hypothetical protein